MIGVTYTPLSSSTNNFCNILENILWYIYVKFYNIDGLKFDAATVCVLLIVMKQFNYTQLISQATRVTGNSATIFDLFAIYYASYQCSYLPISW